MDENTIKKFQKTVWDFYKLNKRSFPWRNTKNPYHILVSEIMLQQTQTSRVIVFYERWIKRFPDFKSLAGAKFSEIYPYWQGLGYNRRAQNLQKTSQKVVREYKGKLPQDISTLVQFYGIGPYTSRAIAIFSWNLPIACIETNIRRVFIHEFFFNRRSLGEGGSKQELVTDQEILKLAELALDKKNPREWHWALMDYGSHLRSTLSLSKGGNPNKRHKNYSVQSKFEGSLRQIRGAALRILSDEATNSKTLLERIKKATNQDAIRIKKVLVTLEKEGLIIHKNKVYSLN